MQLTQVGVLVFAVSLAVAGLRTPLAATRPYEINAIEPLPGYAEFYPTAINTAGQVVGTVLHRFA